MPIQVQFKKDEFESYFEVTEVNNDVCTTMFLSLDEAYELRDKISQTIRAMEEIHEVKSHQIRYKPKVIRQNWILY